MQEVRNNVLPRFFYFVFSIFFNALFFANQNTPRMQPTSVTDSSYVSKKLKSHGDWGRFIFQRASPAAVGTTERWCRRNGPQLKREFASFSPVPNASTLFNTSRNNNTEDRQICIEIDWKSRPSPKRAFGSPHCYTAHKKKARTIRTR